MAFSLHSSSKASSTQVIMMITGNRVAITIYDDTMGVSGTSKRNVYDRYAKALMEELLCQSGKIWFIYVGRLVELDANQWYLGV